MRKATKPISLRLDAEAEEALASLARESGHSRSAVIRAALMQAADRGQRNVSLASEAKRLAADPEDRAETAETADLMEQLRATR